MKTTISRIVLSAFLLSCISFVDAANRYWVADATAQFSNNSSWSEVPDGPPGASIPGIHDVAIYSHNHQGRCVFNSSVAIGGLEASYASLDFGGGQLTVSGHAFIVSSYILNGQLLAETDSMHIDVSTLEVAVVHAGVGRMSYQITHSVFSNTVSLAGHAYYVYQNTFHAAVDITLKALFGNIALHQYIGNTFFADVSLSGTAVYGFYNSQNVFKKAFRANLSAASADGYIENREGIYNGPASLVVSGFGQFYVSASTFKNDVQASVASGSVQMNDNLYHDVVTFQIADAEMADMRGNTYEATASFEVTGDGADLTLTGEHYKSLLNVVETGVSGCFTIQQCELDLPAVLTLSLVENFWTTGNTYKNICEISLSGAQRLSYYSIQNVWHEKAVVNASGMNYTYLADDSYQNGLAFQAQGDNTNYTLAANRFAGPVMLNLQGVMNLVEAQNAFEGPLALAVDGNAYAVSQYYNTHSGAVDNTFAGASNHWAYGNHYGSDISHRSLSRSSGSTCAWYGDVYLGDVKLHSEEPVLYELVAFADAVELKQAVVLSGNTSFSCLPALYLNGTQEQVVSNRTADLVSLQVLKFDNPSGFMLTGDFQVEQTALFDNGLVRVSENDGSLVFTNDAVHLGAGNGSYVIGPVVKEGDDAFVFPVGSTARYAPIGISAPGGEDMLKAIYYGVPQPFEKHLDSSLGYLNHNEYWHLERLAGISPVEVTIGWDSVSTAIPEVLSDLRVARLGEQRWTSEGNRDLQGNQASGTITTAVALTDLGYFTFGISPDCALPAAGVTDTVVACKGAKTSLLAWGGDNYLWSTGATTAALSFCRAIPGIYTVTITNTHLCSAVKEARLLVAPNPVVQLAPWLRAVWGESVTIEAGGGGDYYWSTGETDHAITVVPSKRLTLYTVTVTNSDGCTASDRIVVIARPAFELASWGSLTNAAIDPGDSMIYKTSNNNGWNSGATSVNVLPNGMDGIVKYKITDCDNLNARKMFGLSRFNEDPVHSSIEHGFYFNRNEVEIVESGQGVVSLGQFVVGEEFRIRKVGQMIRYYRNNVLVHQSVLTHREPLYADIALKERGISYFCGIQVTFPSPLTANYDVTEAGTDSLFNIQATGQDGQYPYAYLWNTGATNDLLIAVPAGIYTVTVSDMADSAVVMEIEAVRVAAPMDPEPKITRERGAYLAPSLTLSVNHAYSKGYRDGKIKSKVVGGVRPYQYHWSTGEPTPHLARLSPGFYTLTVIDCRTRSVVKTIQVKKVSAPKKSARMEEPSGEEEVVGSEMSLVLSSAEVFTHGGTSVQKNVSKLAGACCDERIDQGNGLAEDIFEDGVVTEMRQVPSLGTGMPNPCSTHTLIPYFVPEGAGSARLIVQDLSGRVVRMKPLEAGQNEVDVYMANQSEGMYLYSLEVDGMVVATKRMKVVR